ncbi:MAG: response regulator [Pseudomonadota bacterium]
MTKPILVTDDSGLARKQIIRALPAEWDVEVHQATNGIEALEAFHAGRGEFVFLDLTMPEMDGFEVLQSLHDAGADYRVVVVSADIQSGARERVEALGALGFLQKPVQAAELHTLLGELGEL